MSRITMFRALRRYATVPEFPPNLLHLKVGQIVQCQRHEDAEKLYVSQIQIDGEETIQVCSGLVQYIPLEQMLHAKVVVLTNLKPAKMRGVKSEAMLLATEQNDTVELVNAPENSSIGEKLEFEGFGAISNPPRLKSKVWTEIAKHLRTNSKGEAIYLCEDGRESLLKNGLGQVAKANSLEDSIIR